MAAMREAGPWAAPGAPPQSAPPSPRLSAAESPSPTAAPAAGASAPAPASVPRSGVVTVPRPMPLRPMTAADVLDGGIAVIKAAPRTVLAVAVAVVVPLELVTSWVERDTLRDRGVGSILSAASSTTSPLADLTTARIVLVVLSGIALSVVAGALAHLMSAWYADHVESASAALAASARRLPAFAVAWLAVHAFEGVGLLVGVGALLAMPLFVVTAPAIAVERLGPWRGIRRSMQLTRTRYGAVLGIALLVAVVDSLLTLALTGVGLLFDTFDWGWIVDAFCSAGSSLVTVPFVAATASLVYFDLRVRSEGLDLELGIAAHFDGAR